MNETTTLPALEKLVLVTRKTRLQELVERLNSRMQAKFYIEHSGGDWSDYEREDDAYRRALDHLRATLKVGLKFQTVDRSLVPTMVFTEHDVVVTLGQDGLVANVAKYVGAQPIVAVNPQPDRFDGILLPFLASGARGAVERVLAGTAASRRITLAECVLNDGQRLLAFNDFYIGQRTHVSSRYVLRLGARSEPHSSSGVLVATGAGSTGWMSSVFNMAAGVTGFTLRSATSLREAEFAGGTAKARPELAWEDPRLLFAVREPYVSRHSKAGLVAGWIAPGQALEIESLMPQNGVVFSDGVEADFLEFNSGRVAKLGAAKQQAVLVVA